jgi:hypothetical protein
MGPVEQRHQLFLVADPGPVFLRERGDLGFLGEQLAACHTARRITSTVL